MRTLFSTVADSQDKKNELYERFEGLIHAPDDEQFAKKLLLWEEAVKGVQFCKGGEYVDLEPYMSKNWLSCKEMWAKCCRKGLLICGENTTCRLERMWKTVKDDIKAKYGGRKVTTARCIIHVVTFVDSRLQGGLLGAQIKICRIFDDDPDVAAQYEKAGEVLNDKGCRTFQQNVNGMRKRREKMVVSEEGVTETFIRDGEQVPKLYKTTDSSCSCTYFQNFGVPCRHVLFFRMENQLSLFDKTLWRPFFHFERAFDLDDGEQDQDENLPAARHHADSGGCSPSESEDEGKVLDQTEKYKLCQRKANQLTDFLCGQGTAQFLKSMEEWDEILQRARKGVSLLSGPRVGSNQVQQSVGVGEESRGDCRTEESPTIESVKFAADEFEDITFESKVTVRGRPTVKTKDWKRPFNTSRKRKEKAKEDCDTGDDLTDGTVVVSDPSDSDVIVEDPSDVLLCQAPRFEGQFGSNSICLKDYISLSPNTMITDSTVNLHLKLFVHQYEELQKGGIKVLTLGTELGSTLDHWDLQKSKEPPENVRRWIQGRGLWENTALRICCLALCHSFHFYLLAAILDQHKPQMYVLESLNLGNPPPQAKKFAALLEWKMKEAGLKPKKFATSLPLVPEQIAGSNNCGLHLMESFERIMLAPLDFEEKAADEALYDWFDPQIMEEKRTSLAKTIEDMSVDQREPHGELYGTVNAEPVNLKGPSLTKEEV